MSCAAGILDATRNGRLEADPQDVGPAANPAPTPSGSRPGPRWFVVSTYAQAERRAALALSQQGFQVYLPLVLIQRRDRVIPTLIHRVEAPLFPSYLFVRFDLRDPWGPIRHTSGVFQLLTTADNIPEPVSETVIDAIQAGEALRATLPPDGRLIAPGAPVTCLHGAFQGHEAVVITATHTTARIALPIFGAIREVVVSVECLAPRG